MLKILLLLLITGSFSVYASYDAGRIAFDQGDYTRAYEIWLKTANGKTELLNESLQWTNSSLAQQRNAQYAIAVLYWQGKGVDQDYTLAAKWLKRAIESGHYKAQLKLGFLYMHGRGVEKDEVEARKRFLIAADHGYVDAQFNLGMMHLMGLGGKQNVSKAKYWLKQAALQGDGQAFEELMKIEEANDSVLPLEKNHIKQKVEQAEKKPIKKQQPIHEKSDILVSLKSESVIKPDLQPKFLLHQPAWLLQQPGKKYALQVIAFYSMRRLRSFTESLSATGDWVYYFKHKDNRNYVVLLRCCFQDETAAKRIMQSLPSEVKNLQPIVVRLKNIISELNAN
jgi:hypothetical protein